MITTKLATGWDDEAVEPEAAVAVDPTAAINPEKPKVQKPMDKLIQSVLTETAVEERRKAEREARWVLEGLALMGDATVLYASFNVGKTLAVLWLLKEALAKSGSEEMKVFYLNADDNYSGANDKAEWLAKTGIQMLVPGQGGFEFTDFPLLINQLITEEKAHGFVLVLDTLKKFTDLMDKREAAGFGKLIRSFVQAGGTVVALAHVNKHKAADGKSIYEGSGDIINDFDAAYTIERDTPEAAAHCQISFVCNKSRGPNVQKASFTYNAGEAVSWKERFQSIERVDNAKARETVDRMHAAQQLKNDRACVDYLAQRIRDAGTISRRDLTQDDLTNGISKKTREQVLDRYDATNPREDCRLWSVVTNAKGGRSYLINGGFD